MDVRLAALSTRLDEAGQPDVADRIDTMMRSALKIPKIGFERPLLTAPIRGLGKAITWTGRHPLAALGLGTAGLTGKHYMEQEDPHLDDALRSTWDDLKGIPGRLGRAYRGFMFSPPHPGQRVETAPAGGEPSGWPTPYVQPQAPPPNVWPVTPPYVMEPTIPGYVGEPMGQLQGQLPGMGYDPNEPVIPPGVPVQDFSYAEGVAGVPVGGR